MNYLFWIRDNKTIIAFGFRIIWCFPPQSSASAITPSSNSIIIQVILSLNRPIIPNCHICLSPIFSFEAQTSGLNKICSKHRTLETRAPYTSLAVTVQNVPASSPVARNHLFFVWGWGARGGRVFELINKESGGEGSDRKGERAIHDLAGFISHHPPLVLWVRSYHPTLAHLARLQHPALKVCALH